jgi:hypothetical protein
VLRQSREQEAEHVKTHAEILHDHEELKNKYNQYLETTLGVIILLVVAFFAVKITAPEL